MGFVVGSVIDVRKTSEPGKELKVVLMLSRVTGIGTPVMEV